MPDESAVPAKVSLLIYSFAPNFIAFGFILVAISAWFLQVGFTAAQIGLLIGAEGAAAIVSAIPLGIVSDIYGRRRLLVAGALTLSFSFLIFALTLDFFLLLFAAVLGGVAEGATTSSWNALIADRTTLANRSKALSLSFVVSNVGSGAGFLVPFFIPAIGATFSLDSYGTHRWLLLIFALGSFITPVSASLLLRDHREATEGRRSWAGLKNKVTLAKIAVFAGSIGLGAGFIIPIFATWLSLRFGVGDYYSGPVLAISNLLIGFSSLASPRLAARFGQQRAIVLTTGSSTAFMFSMAFLTNVNVAAACYIVRTALMNMSGPLTDSFVMGLFPAEQRGLVSALTNIVFRLPNNVSVLAGGYLLSVGLLELPWFIACALYIVGITMFYAFFARVKNRF